MDEETFDFERVLKALTEHKVDFIVVGGVCAALHGASVTTLDLDIVHSRDADNLDRLTQTLTELDAYYREHPPHRFVPEAQRLASPGHHLLMTNAGPVDVLGTLAGGRDYAQLLPHTVEQPLTEGLSVRMLDLPTLIQVKQETGREKDRLMLPVLRRTLEEVERTSSVEQEE